MTRSNYANSRNKMTNPLTNGFMDQALWWCFGVNPREREEIFFVTLGICRIPIKTTLNPKMKWLTWLQYWNSNTLRISLRLFTSHPFLVWKLRRGCLCIVSVLYFFQHSSIFPFTLLYFILMHFISFHFPFICVTSMSFHYLFISFHCPYMSCPKSHR